MKTTKTYILMNKEENRIHYESSLGSCLSGDLSVMNFFSPFTPTTYKSKLAAWWKGMWYGLHPIELKTKDHFSWDSIGTQGSYTYIQHKKTGVVYRCWLESEYTNDYRTKLTPSGDIYLPEETMHPKKDFVELDWN